MAEKLDIRAGQERINKALIIESIAQIQESRNPRVVEELLRTYLPTKVQEGLEAGGANAEANA